MLVCYLFFFYQLSFLVIFFSTPGGMSTHKKLLHTFIAKKQLFNP